MRTPKRNRRLQFEVMESREVLTATTVVTAMASAALVVPLASPQEALAVSMTTDRLHYNLGQQVNMTLTARNISSQDVTVEIEPSNDGFFITHNEVTVWASNMGPEPLLISMENLKPGQSFTLKATWNGMQNVATGLYVVHNQMFPTGLTAVFTVGNHVATN